MLFRSSELEWVDNTNLATDNKNYCCPCKVTLELDRKSDILIATFEYEKYGLKQRADLSGGK